ncbi:MAG: hydroxyquinol 1,2-dioxygenase [Acidobacteriota bacterium]|nr:hydroxyquinol 1,2-dioxygenase [Acidobacteriota bacterium]
MTPSPVTRELDQYNITDVALDQMSDTPDQRLKEIMDEALRHMHAFARKVDLKPEELLKGLLFLTQVGQKCTPHRQEFILLSEVLGLETAVNILDDLRGNRRATRTSILGPFHVDEPPWLELGASLCPHVKGQEIALYGRVTDSAGAVLSDAVVEIWQTDEEGLYDVQRHEELDLRGRFRVDAQGRYFLRTIRPLGYSIPMDGPVGDLIRAQGRHGMRPAHIHFIVKAPQFRRVTTAVYLKNDQYIDSDTVFGVTASLIRDINLNDPDSPFPELASLRFDFTLDGMDASNGR